MSSLFDSLSEELFQVLKGSGKTLTLYGEDGNKTYEPKSARRVFATPDNIMISVVEAGSDSEVKLYLSQSTDVRGISKLITTLRQITTRYNVLFNVRKYGRELQPKDFAYQATNEAAMYGSTKSSYQKFGQTKLIVRHCRPVIEGVIGARGRNILGMFVETAQGERFKFAENHLSAGRAFAQHINQGGKPHDEIGTKLAILAQESLSLARVNRYIHHSRNVLGEAAVALRTPIKSRIVELRRAFVAMGRPRGYHKVKESLPTTTANLNEATADRLGQLQSLLMIDSNHALAESLMPVALLQMGENMTDTNSMFHGVLTLEDTAADALVEALLDEYGHNNDNWTRFGSNIAFNEGAVFEDATGYLDLVETAYQINEADAILDYATQWTNARVRNSGATDAAGNLIKTADDSKDTSVDDLATGLRAILGGQIKVPELPDHFPGFRDENAKGRFYLDMFVAQHLLANAATLNYVSTIIDKMSEGKKLDGAEKTVAGKLIAHLEKFMDEGDIDESYYGDDPYDDRHDGKYEAALEDIADQFDVQAFVADIYPFVLDGDEKEDALETSYVMANLDAHIAIAMDQMDFRAEKGQFKNQAEDLLPQVKEFCEQRGYHFDDVVREFAETEDKPEHHGIAAGDHVATDMGPATVISIEGDIASVEFLHGGAKQMHIDDMDKLPELAKFGEEAELSEWFNGFDPEQVLEAGFEGGMVPIKKAAPTNPNFSSELNVGDRVTHKVYGSGAITAVNDKMAKVVFDEAHQRLPDNKTVTVSKGVLTKAGAYRAEAEELDELSPAKYGDYFSKAAGDRGRQEKRADNGDEKAALRLKGRDAGLSTAFKKMRNETFETATKSALAEGLMTMDHLESIMNEFKAFAAKVFADPETYGVEMPVGTDDMDEQEMNFNSGISHVLTGFIADKIQDVSTNATLESEEVMGGDQGEDLINDVKVTEAPSDVFAPYSDEMLKSKLNLAVNDPKYADYAEQLRSELTRRGHSVTESDMFKEQLADLLKNANFRR